MKQKFAKLSLGFLAAMALLVTGAVSITTPVDASAEDGSVAKISSTGESYASLADAIAEAEADDTVEVLQNVTVNEIIEINKSLKIVGGEGITVTSTADKAFVIENENNTELKVSVSNLTVDVTKRAFDTRDDYITLNLDNVHIEASSTNAQPITISYDEKAEGMGITTVNINECSVNAGRTGYAIISFVQSEINITESELTGYAAIYMKEGSAGSVVSVEGGTLTGNGLAGKSNDFGTIVFETNGVSVTLKDSAVSVNGEANAEYALAFVSVAEDKDVASPVVSIEGSTTVTLGSEFTLTRGDGASEKNVQATDGLAYVVDETGTVTFATTEKISEIATEAAAKNGSNYYATLQQAIADAKAGDTVEVLQNVTVNEIIEINKSLTIVGGENITVTSTSTEKKVFEIKNESDAEMEVNVSDLTVVAYERAFDTRNDQITLNLDNVHISVTKENNAQPITIGGYEQGGVVVNIDECSVDAGRTGYAIISFVKADIFIKHSDIEAWSVLYMKEGSAGSAVSVEGGTLTGTGLMDNNEENTFGMIVFEDENIDVALDSVEVNVTAESNIALYSLVLLNKKGTEPLDESTLSVEIKGDSNVKLAGGAYYTLDENEENETVESLQVSGGMFNVALPKENIAADFEMVEINGVSTVMTLDEYKESVISEVYAALAKNGIDKENVTATMLASVRSAKTVAQVDEMAALVIEEATDLSEYKKLIEDLKDKVDGLSQAVVTLQGTVSDNNFKLQEVLAELGSVKEALLTLDGKTATAEELAQVYTAIAAIDAKLADIEAGTTADNSALQGLLIASIVLEAVILVGIVAAFVLYLVNKKKKAEKACEDPRDPTDPADNSKTENTAEVGAEGSEENDEETEEAVEAAEETVEAAEKGEEETDDAEVEEPDEAGEVEENVTEEVEAGEELATAEDGVLSRFALLGERKLKTFEERMLEADEQTKLNYEEIKKELLSYKRVKSRVSKKCESFRIGRKLVAKIVLRRKGIRCYLALDPQAYPFNSYHHRNAGDKKAYESVPMLMRVRSPRSVKRVKKLIAELALQNGAVKL